MNHLPQGINGDDLHQWLGGGVCMARIEGQWVPALYEGVVRNDREGLPVECAVTVGETFDRNEVVTLNNLAGHWPVIGSVNIRAHRVAVHVDREPAKQFKRTFHSRLCKVTVPRRWDVQKVIGDRGLRSLQTPTVPIINALFAAWYPTPEQAFDLLDSGWLSVAIDPRVIVAADQNGKRMIYFRGELAATTAGGMLDPVADVLTCRLINKALAGRFQWTVDLHGA